MQTIHDNPKIIYKWLHIVPWMEHIVTILLFACHNVRTYGVKKQFCRASISIYSYSLVSCERDEMFFLGLSKVFRTKRNSVPKNSNSSFHYHTSKVKLSSRQNTQSSLRIPLLANASSNYSVKDIFIHIHKYKTFFVNK